MPLPLHIIAQERNTELRLRLLDRWIHQFCRRVWYWDDTMELWCQRYELDPAKPMTEEQSEAYDQLVHETTLAALLNLEEVPAELAGHGPWEDVF